MSVSPVPRPGGRSRRGRLLASSGALIAAVLMLSAAPAVQAQAPAAYAQEPRGTTGQDLSGGADSLPLMIDRFAGGGFGEGGPAVEAALVNPSGMAADGQGNLYIADGMGERLLKVTAEGTVTAVANADAQPRMCSTGPSCPDGVDLESVDGLPARDAGIQPWQVAVGPGGDLLVLESPYRVCSLHRIDAVTGIIDTLIEQPEGCRDRTRNPVDGPIESATIARPQGGMATGPDGSVYFVDTRLTADENGPTGNVIRRIDPSLTTVSTVAGGGDQEPADGMTATDARLANPGGGDCGVPQLAVGSEGLLHFTCSTPGLGWGRIWRVEESGALRLVAGGGRCCERRDGEDAVGAFISFVASMVFVGEGGPREPGLYFTDGGVMRRISPDGKVYTIDDYSDTLGLPLDLMVVDSANRLFASSGWGPSNYATSPDEGEHTGMRVYELAPDGTATPVVGNGLWAYYGQDGTPAAEAGFGYFSRTAADAAGNVYVRDAVYERTFSARAVVRRIDADTGQVTRVAGVPKAGPFGECRPEVSGPALDAVICNRGATENGIAVDSAGNVYLTAGYQPCRYCSNPDYFAIYRVDAQTGTIEDIWSCGAGDTADPPDPTCVDGVQPTGLHVDDSDTLFFSQEGGRVNRLDNVGPDWVATTIADITPIGTGAGAGDLTGDAQGRLYFAYKNRAYRVEPGPGDPTGLVWTVTPVAGTGESGFSGDGGPATQAQLYWATGVAVDAGGNLLIADSQNYRVRRVDADTGIITTIAGDGACCTYTGVLNWAVGAYSGDGGPAATASLTGPTAVTVLPDGRVLITDGRKLRVIDDRPVTFADLRQQVESFRDTGAVTQSAAKRMLSKVDRAETAANRGDTTKAIELLDEFKQIAADPKHVPEPDAREVLIGLADRLITQLRSTG